MSTARPGLAPRKRGRANGREKEENEENIVIAVNDDPRLAKKIHLIRTRPHFVAGQGADEDEDKDRLRQWIDWRAGA